MEEKKKHSIKVRVILFILVIAIISLSITSIYAWFYYGRNAAAFTEISNPTALFINAGHEEEIDYLDLSGIDIKQGRYKDFVFCIKGTNITKYALQLAYTTNNQFTYEIYPATETSSTPPANDGVVEYQVHDNIGSKYSYYIPQGMNPVNGSFLNKNGSASEELALDNDTYFEKTYETYEYEHKYAIPLYWQSVGIVHMEGSTTGQLNGNGEYIYAHPYSGNFTDYFILRIIWGENAENNKETDIIYISARNKS